jgi:hypothetical protein
MVDAQILGREQSAGREIAGGDHHRDPGVTGVSTDEQDNGGYGQYGGGDTAGEQGVGPGRTVTEGETPGAATSQIGETASHGRKRRAAAVRKSC